MALTEEQREIALQVASEVDDGTGEQMFTDTEEWIVEFAQRFLAALPKPEPVGVFANVNEMIPGAGARWEHTMDEAYNPDDGYIYLYKEAPIAQPASAPSEQKPFEIIWPTYHDEAMGCGLEDRGITDRYEAMQHGWDCAIERVAECLPEIIYEAPQPDYKAQRDAERYRWIRTYEIGKVISAIRSQDSMFFFEDSLDAAIDAAIASVKGGA